MPYIFLILVIINILALGYFNFVHEEDPTESVIKAKENLTAPTEFENNSSSIPPVIGKKDAKE